MNATATDVFDTIVDAYCTKTPLAAEQLQTITASLYTDRRGGQLADLYASEEFMHALEYQLNNN